MLPYKKKTTIDDVQAGVIVHDLQAGVTVHDVQVGVVEHDNVTSTSDSV